MSVKSIERTPSAYYNPLLIKNLLDNPVRQFPDQEIVYGDFKRQTYRELGERIGRLASGLAGLGVKSGDTVAVMDWDSHRYLECFFAVPMMGAVLHTVNIRLSPEQILYTINHAEDDVILVNTEFLPILETIRDRIEPVKKLVLLNDTGADSGHNSGDRHRVRSPAGFRRPRLQIPGFLRGHARHHVLHHRHDRSAQGRVFQPSATGVAHPGDARGAGRFWSGAVESG